MLASFLLTLREGLEGALVIGIALAALRKLGRSHLGRSIWQGTFGAIAVSIVAGLVINWIGAEFTGAAEEIFEGTTMVIAAVLLTWMILWMRRQSANLRGEIENGIVKASAGEKNRPALFWLAFLAVGREGIELVLFLVAVRISTDAVQTISGAILGMAAAIVLGWLLFTSSKRLSLQHFFSITSILLILFAAGLLAHGVHAFNEAGIIPSVIEHVWDFNPILDEKQPLGQLLTALFGYNGNPSLTEVLAYGLYLLGSVVLWVKTRPRSMQQAA